MIVSGSYDGTMRIWDLKQRKPVCIEICKHFEDSVTQLIVQDYFIFASSVDGRVRCFDIRAGEMTSDCIGEPIVSMDMTIDKKSLLLSCLNGEIYLFNIIFGECLSAYNGHQIKDYSIRLKLSKDNSFFVTGSEDSSICFYTLLEKKPKHILKGQNCHKKAVSCVDLNKKDNSMVSCSHDGQIIFWKSNISVSNK